MKRAGGRTTRPLHSYPPILAPTPAPPHPRTHLVVGALVGVLVALVGAAHQRALQHLAAAGRVGGRVVG